MKSSWIVDLLKGLTIASTAAQTAAGIIGEIKPPRKPKPRKPKAKAKILPLVKTKAIH